MMAAMRFWTLGWAVLLGFLLSACGLRAWVDVEITEESSGTVTLQLQSDQELRDGLAAFSPDTDVVGELSAGLVEDGWEIEDVPPDGEWQGVIASKPFADLAELSGLLDQATQGGGSSIEVVETSDAYQLSAELGPPQGDDNQQQLISQAAEVVDLDGRLTVRFPGEVTETNGEVQPDGSTVVWAYDEESIAGLEVRAEARKPTGFLVWIIVLLAAVAVAGIAVVVLVNRARETLNVER